MGNIHMTPTKPRLIKEQAPWECSDSMSSEKTVDYEYDIFRDGLFRYMGYANEVGEAFRRHISRKMLYASYAIATAYVCADTIHKSYRSIKKGETATKTIISAGDAFVWQMFASILIPGFVINRITYYTRRLVRLKRKKCICKASPFVRYTPVTVGLLSIPFVVHPIDRSVTWAMDKTVRKMYAYPESNEAAGPLKDSKSKK